MVDVKNLVKTTLLFEKISLFFIFFSIVIISYKNGFKKLFNFIFNIVYKSLLLWSGIFLIILLGIIINFNATFILFHKIFFRNDLWILDPRTDYLLIMFPERFFLEVCLAILIVFVIINLLFFMTSWLLDKKLNPRWNNIIWKRYIIYDSSMTLIYWFFWIVFRYQYSFHANINSSQYIRNRIISKMDWIFWDRI